MTDFAPLEPLKSAGLIRSSRLNPEALARISLSKLMDAIARTVESTDAGKLERTNSAFSHTATMTLSGGPSPCSEPACRKRNARHLAEFAALYSDRVYAYNHLADYLHHPPRDGDADRFRAMLATDIEVLLVLAPLARKGFINIVTPRSEYCPQCLAIKNFGPEADKRYTREQARLKERLQNELEVRVEAWSPNGPYPVRINGPESILDHGRAWLFPRPPGALSSRPRLLAQLQSGKSVVASKSLRRALGVEAELTREAFRDLLFEMTIAQALGASFLADSQLHVDLLNALSEDTEASVRNSLVLEHLTSIVPFAGDLSIDKLLRLREREGDAFAAYRQALNAAIVAYRKGSGGRFNATDARQLYADIIAPALAALDRKVKAAKRDLVASTARRTVAWTGALAFGIYAGFVPAAVVAGAKMLGLAKAVQELVELTMAKSDTEAAVRTDNLYFLWKARRAAG